MGIIAGVLFDRRLHPARSTDCRSLWVDAAALHRDRLGHADRRLAHHPHDGVEDHQAAAGGRLRGGNGRGAWRCSRPRIRRAGVSTTHTITGAIVGVGATRRLSAVRWGVAGQIVWAWMLTIPGGRRAIMAPSLVRSSAAHWPRARLAPQASVAASTASSIVNAAPPRALFAAVTARRAARSGA